MAVNLDLIDKVIDLKCPVCGTTYQYSLIKIMGFNLGGGNPTLNLLRFLRVLLFGEGETIGVAIARPSPGIMKQLLDTLTKTRATPNPQTQDIRAKIEEKMEKELTDPHTYIFTCPKDQKQMQVTLHLDNGEVNYSDLEAATLGNVALFETGNGRSAEPNGAAAIRQASCVASTKFEVCASLAVPFVFIFLSYLIT